MNRYNVRIPEVLDMWDQADAFLDALVNLGGDVIAASSRRPWVTVWIPDGADPLALPGVSAAEPDEPMQLLGPVYSQTAELALNEDWSWATLRVGAQQAHQITRGEGVHIASIDTGFAFHQEFTGADIRTVTMVDDPEFTDPTDTDGHGVAVLSMMASQGVEILGSAPGATFHNIKVTNDGENISQLLLADTVDMARDLGADIINLSVGGSFIASQFRESIQEFLNAGGLVLASAGNNGSSNNEDTSLRYPALLPEVIAVGASYKADDRPAIPFVINSNFGSAWGPWPDSPDCIAPGDEVVVANRFGTYTTWGGTSFACPLVAGLFALSMSANPAMWDVSGTRTDPKYGFPLPARVVLARELLRETCIDVGAGRDRMGYGLVDALALVEAEIDAPVVVQSVNITPTSATIEVGQTRQFSATAHYSDGATETVTSQANWFTSNAGTIDISSTGQAEGVNQGTAEVFAQFDGVESNRAQVQVEAVSNGGGGNGNGDNGGDEEPEPAPDFSGVLVGLGLLAVLMLLGAMVSASRR